MRTSVNYRKVYSDHWGVAIPEGFVVHHIDGNSHNNNPINLVAMSHEDHDLTHIAMGDTRAGGSWAGWSRAGNDAMKIRYAKGDTKSHLKGDARTDAQKIKDANARCGEDRTPDQLLRDESIRGVTNGRIGDKHPLWGKVPWNKGMRKVSDICSKMSKFGKRKVFKTCPHCQLSMHNNYNRYHGDNCKLKEKTKC